MYGKNEGIVNFVHVVQCFAEILQQKKWRASRACIKIWIQNPHQKCAYVWISSFFFVARSLQNAVGHGQRHEEVTVREVMCSNCSQLIIFLHLLYSTYFASVHYCTTYCIIHCQAEKMSDISGLANVFALQNYFEHRNGLISHLTKKGFPSTPAAWKIAIKLCGAHEHAQYSMGWKKLMAGMRI